MLLFLAWTHAGQGDSKCDVMICVCGIFGVIGR